MISVKLDQRGVTLLELMVALAIFVTVITMATSIFQGVIAGQRSTIAAQNTQERQLPG
jgi:prepilin-type N-terminal cleavage/methylation domain-containing protein